MDEDTVEVSGIQLRTNGDRIEVLAEVDGAWRLVISEPCDCLGNVISHVAEPSAIRNAPTKEL